MTDRQSPGHTPVVSGRGLCMQGVLNAESGLWNVTSACLYITLQLLMKADLFTF